MQVVLTFIRPTAAEYSYIIRRYVVRICPLPAASWSAPRIDIGSVLCSLSSSVLLRRRAMCRHTCTCIHRTRTPYKNWTPVSDVHSVSHTIRTATHTPPHCTTEGKEEKPTPEGHQSRGADNEGPLGLYLFSLLIFPFGNRAVLTGGSLCAQYSHHIHTQCVCMTAFTYVRTCLLYTTSIDGCLSSVVREATFSSMAAGRPMRASGFAGINLCIHCTRTPAKH